MEIDGRRILKIDIDGMDQAKWKCPRNLESSKKLEKLWRPQLHLVGIIVWGVMEKYVILPPNVPKDASGMLTVLAQALDDVEEILTKRGLKVPSHICVQLDNTTSENKNSANLAFSAYLAATNRFETYQTGFHRVGHTHGPVDQRFSVIRKILNSARRLEVPQDFADCLLEKMQPIRNREVIVEVAGNTYAMAPWVQQLGIHVKGLTPNPGGHERNLNTNHIWRVVQRRALDAYVMKDADSWKVVM